MRAKALMTALIILAASMLTGEVEGAARRRPVDHPAPWHRPQCSMTTGTGAAVLSLDGGQTVLPSDRQLSEVTFTYGIAALEKPNRYIALENGRVLLSRDGGCSWRAIGALEEVPFPPFLTPTRGESAWAWTGNYDGLWKIDGINLARRKSPVDGIAGLTFDRAKPESVRIAGADGSFWESDDDGLTWELVARLKLEVPILYRVAWDPADPEHAIAGTATTGALVTFDGGTTWTSSRGLSATGGPVNAMNAVISPVDGNVVWLMAIDLEQSNAQEPSMGRHIYRSTDGGRTFEPVIDRSPAVTITNGPVMAAHPTDANRLYFVFGTYFQGYGTDLFDFDASNGALRIHHHPFDDIDGIAFSPADPAVMLFGLERSR
jgi:hypothetical protein